MHRYNLIVVAITLLLGHRASSQTTLISAPQVSLDKRIAKVTSSDFNDSFSIVEASDGPSFLGAPLPSEDLLPNTFFPCAEIDFIGGTFYDLQTNRSIDNRLVSAGGESLTAWTGSLEYSPFGDRGSYVQHGSLNNWSSDYSRVEEVRTGWPSVVSCTDVEHILVSHIVDTVPSQELYLAYRTESYNEWQHGRVPSAIAINKLWPRAVSAGLDGNTVHVVTHLDGIVEGQNNPLIYARSIDAGQTWGVSDHFFDELNVDVKKEFAPEAYALHARGDMVALAVFGLVDDSYVLVSTDNGTTWNRTKFFDFPIDGYEPDDGLPEDPTVAEDFNGDGIAQEYLSTDGSGSVHIDHNGVVHVAFGSMYYMDADTTDGGYSSFSTTNGLHYWNTNMAENGAHLIGQAPDLNANGVLDLDIIPTFNYNVGLASMPTFASGEEEGLFLSFSAVTEGFIAFNGMNCRHQFLIQSSDGGATWNTDEPTDLTPDGGPQTTNFEYSYGCLNSDLVNGSLQLLVQRDYHPGIFLLGNHPETYSNTWFIDVPLESIAGTEVCLVGCMDEEACNYDEWANTEAECFYPEQGLNCWGGCVDANACNFIDEGLDVYEGFNGYAEGTWVSSLPNWVPWYADSLEMPPDAQVVIAPMGQNGDISDQALKLHTPYEGGASDVVYVTDVAGVLYLVGFDVLIPSGGLARYNFQEFAEPGLGWAFEGLFHPDGTYEYTLDGLIVASGTYVQDDWFNLMHAVDMLNDVITIYLNGQSLASFAYDSSLGGVNFYSLDAAVGNEFYIDNLSVFLGANGSCEYCGAEVCEDETASNFGAIGACCYPNATYPNFSLLKSWRFSDGVDAIMVGEAPGLGEDYTGPVVPVQENDRFTFFANGAFHYETQGDILDAYGGYSNAELEFDMAGFAIAEGAGWNGTDQVYLLNGAFGYAYPFIGVLDSGPFYDILELTDETLVLTAPVNDEFYQPTGQYFTLRFVADEDFSPDSDGMCDWGCTDATSAVYDAGAIYDNGLCVIDSNAYNCEDIGDDVWEAIPLGLSPDYQSGMVGINQSWSWVFNVPSSLVEPASGVTYGVHHVEWLSLAGTPEWAALGPVPTTDMGPSTQHCIEITGTPPATGTYVLSVTCEGFIAIFGQPFSSGEQVFEVTLEIMSNPNPILGCAYPLAANYLEYSTEDDGTCLFAGCTDPEAGNFNPLANVDDGSCGDTCLTEPIAGCTSDLDNDGAVSVSDLLLLLGEFGNTCE
jgi:hypothetical protein